MLREGVLDTTGLLIMNVSRVCDNDSMKVYDSRRARAMGEAIESLFLQAHVYHEPRQLLV